MSQFNLACRTDRDITVSGVVTDAATNEILPFANIYMTLDTTIGTAANENGEFTITVPYNSTLTVSYTGYTPTKFEAQNAYEKVMLQSDGNLDTVYLEGENKKKKGFGWLWLLVFGGLAVASTSSEESKPKSKAPIKARI